MTTDEIIQEMDLSRESSERCRSICHRSAQLLDEYEASSLDAVRAMAFMLGSAIESLSADTGAPLDDVLEVANVLVRASAQLHAQGNGSTEGMTPN